MRKNRDEILRYVNENLKGYEGYIQLMGKKIDRKHLFLASESAPSMGPCCRMNFSHRVDFPLLRTPVTIWARLLDGESCLSSILSHSSDRSCDSSSSFWSEKMVISLLASMSS